MIIDWIEGTILNRNTKSVLDDLRALFRCDWIALPKGMYGYASAALVYESGRVLWGGSDDMGVHVSLPSSAISLSGFDPISLLVDLRKLGMRFTRVDLAADDFEGILNLDSIEHCTKNGLFASRWRKWLYNEDSGGGRTWYYGDSQSDARMRIYDKAAERRGAGEDYQGHWVRVELRLKDERADAAVSYIIQHLDGWHGWACGVIRGYIDFKDDSSSDSNATRRKTALWWDRFLQSASRQRITVPIEVRTIDDVARWFEHQLAPSVCVLRTVFGEDKFTDMVTAGSSRWRSKHLSMIDRALAYGSGRN